MSSHADSIQHRRPLGDDLHARFFLNEPPALPQIDFKHRATIELRALQGERAQARSSTLSNACEAIVAFAGQKNLEMKLATNAKRRESHVAEWLVLGLGLSLGPACGAPDAPPSQSRAPSEASVNASGSAPTSPPAESSGRAVVSDTMSDKAKPPKQDEAIAAFRRAWHTNLASLTGWEKENAEYIDGLMKQQPQQFKARLAPCRELLDKRRRFGTVFTLQGAIEALDRSGECWETSFSGGMKAEVVGYLDPRTLDLVHLWRVPEG